MSDLFRTARHLLTAAALTIPAVSTAHAAELRATVTALPPIVFFDANPELAGRPLSAVLARPPEPLVAADDQSAASPAAELAAVSPYLFPVTSREDHRRTGVAADGVSQLLVRAYLPGPGAVSCWVSDDAGVVDPDRNGVCEVLYPADPVFPVAYSFGTVKQIHAAFARYIPPRAFGSPSAAEQAAFAPAVKRRLTVHFGWRDAQSPTTPEFQIKRELLLERPPVVLVHGTYDNPRDCWDYGTSDKHWTMAPALYRQKGLAAKLRDRGFNVFLVDYELSNGLSGQQRLQVDLSGSLGSGLGGAPAPDLRQVYYRRSHFRDNQHVVWDGGGKDEQHKGEGIAAALEAYRSRGVAATQADVVGHSMGGVLIRVYARGAPVAIGAGDQCVPPARPDTPEGPGNWYYRKANFGKGDINRIITIGSTHKGSHMSGLLQHYSVIRDTSGDGIEGVLGAGGLRASEVRRATNWTPGRGFGSVVWTLANWSLGQFDRGAFTDQIPESPALMCLGATPVPAHAIAGVATIDDLDLFKGIEGDEGLYRGRMNLVWSATPRWFLNELFRQRLKHPDDARDLLDFLDRADRVGLFEEELIARVLRERSELERFMRGTLGQLQSTSREIAALERRLAVAERATLSAAESRRLDRYLDWLVEAEKAKREIVETLLRKRAEMRSAGARGLLDTYLATERAELNALRSDIKAVSNRLATQAAADLTPERTQLEALRKEADALNALFNSQQSRHRELGETVDRLRARARDGWMARREAILTRAKSRFAASVFGNDHTDFTVSLDSQLGGLAEGSGFVSIVPANFRDPSAKHGVLHGYEPRHPDIQNRVIELLQGDMTPFRPQGFPPSGRPAYYAPQDPRAFAPARIRPEAAGTSP